MNAPASPQSFWRQVTDACFLDLPYLVDSRWRHIEYALSRNHEYRVRAGAVTMSARPRNRNAAFVLLLITLTFVAYGPTFAAICGAGGVWLSRVLYGALTLGFVLLGLLAIGYSRRGIFARCAKRLHERGAGKTRRVVLYTLATLIVGLAAIACWLIAQQAFGAVVDPQLCATTPYSWRAFAQAGVSVAAAIAATWLAGAKLSSLSFARRQSALIIGLWAISWWLLAAPDAREADGVPYRHSFALFAAALFAIPLLAAPLARRLFRSVPPQTCAAFALGLRHTELLTKRVEPEMSLRRLINALVNGPLYHPLHLFFLPALVAVMASNDWLWSLCLTALLFSGLLLTWGCISIRWQQMNRSIDRWFFSGTPLAISLGVIALAGARLMGNQYVTTLLGAAPFGVIFMWVLMTYAALWLYEQAINQALGPQILRVLGNCNDVANKVEPDYIHYPADDIVNPLAATDNRYIALHGAGRFAVVGVKLQGDHLFHTYTASELFAKLAANADVVEQKVPVHRGLHADLTEAAHDIDRRIKLNFNVLNLAVLLIVGSLLWYTKESDGHRAMEPVVSANAFAPEAPPTKEHFDLTRSLRQQAQNKRPAFIVAASGGGTRAAVYTASALRGMAQLGLTDDIVLMSGVSGGGVALAYYAMHKPHLPVAANFDAQAWDRYRERMAEPFIQDVLEGTTEWRIAGPTPLSALLVESFQRRLVHGGRTTLGDVRDVGLILNTSITGHPATDSVLVANAMGGDTQRVHEHDCLPFALLSGERLSFTNIADTHRFPLPTQSRLPDVGLSYVLVNDPLVPLVSAAALNANFPPVFPNARVDLKSNVPGCGGVRTYHVTDGGATENLGLISALYALQSSLDAMRSDGNAVELPELHIVALEASAIGMDYAQDRGIGTATGGAKERLAGGLAEQIIAMIEQQATQLAGRATKLHLHYLAMPTAFRSRGGVGTHWMLPSYVTITNPHLPTAPGFWAELPLADAADRINVRLSKQELFALLDNLHDPQASVCNSVMAASNGIRIANDWICSRDAAHPTAPDLHVTEWRKLIGAKPQPNPHN